MIRGLVVTLVALAGAASAQDVTVTPAPIVEDVSDAAADPFAGTRAFICHLGSDILLVPLQATGGGLVAQGDFASWRVTESGDRVSLVLGDTFLQIDGANSLAVADGTLLQGDCLEVSSELRQLIAQALGGEPGQAIVSLRDTWIGRAQRAEERILSLEAEAEAHSLEAEERVQALQADAHARSLEAEGRIEALETTVAALRRTQGSCASHASRILPWIAEDLPRLGQADASAEERRAVVQTMSTRLAALQRVCGGG